MYRTHFWLIATLFGLAACTTSTQSNPARTATEQLLISAAADRAVAQFELPIVENAAVFFDTSLFDATDGKYAIGALRAALLRHGARLVDDKHSADLVVEARAGALSIDRTTFLIGIPQFTMPIPLTTQVTTPEIALYGTEDQAGIAKFALTSYDAKSGKLIEAQEPQYGFSHNTKRTVLLFISWNDSDAVPEESTVTHSDVEAWRTKRDLPHPDVPLPKR